ncbi:META domain-containing protein [Chloroflexota bacterium]
MLKSKFYVVMLILGVLALLSGACAKPDSAITASDLEGTAWILESYGEPENLKDILTDTEITAEFISSEGTVKGSAGCNSYFGSYEVEGSQLSLPGPIAVTEMYCMEPEGVMEQEQQYLEILQAAESYSTEDRELQINCGDQVLVYIAE